MKTLTKEKAIKHFRKVFNKLAKSGDREEPESKYRHNCALCEYTQNIADQLHKEDEVYIGSKEDWWYCAGLCPIEWPPNQEGQAACHQPGNLWKEWDLEEDLLFRCMLAHKIANLPAKTLTKENNGTNNNTK